MAKMGGNLASRTTSSVFHEIWHRCLPWGVDVQDTFFDSGRKCVAMVTAYGKNGKILRRELLPQFFTNSHEIWHRCLSWGVDVQDTLFLHWQKVCCHGNGILWGNSSVTDGTSIPDFSDISLFFTTLELKLMVVMMFTIIRRGYTPNINEKKLS